MTDIKRRLTDIKFEHEGAHVALVGKHQGGPANGITTLVFKATDHIDPAQVALAIAGQSAEQPTTIIEEPIVEQIEKSVHEALMATAVSEAVAVQKAAGDAALAEVQTVLKAAQEQLAAYAAAEAAAVVKAREEALKAVVPADKVEALLKAYAPMDAEGFALAVEVLALQKAAEAGSDMFKEAGVQGNGEQVTATDVDQTMQIIKAKYGIK